MADEAPTFDVLQDDELARDVWQALCRYASSILHKDLHAVEGGMPATFFISREITLAAPSDTVWSDRFLLFVGGEDETALSDDRLHPDGWDRMGFFRKFFFDRYHYLTLTSPILPGNSELIGERLRSLILKLITPREPSLPSWKELWQNWCGFPSNDVGNWKDPERWKYVAMSADSETRARLRTQRFHGKLSHELARLRYADMLLGECLWRLYGSHLSEKSPLKILWIDDNLDGLRKHADELAAFYDDGTGNALRIWAVSGTNLSGENSLALFWRMLTERHSSDTADKHEKLAVGHFVTPITGNSPTEPPPLQEYDLILLDLELEKHPGTIEPGRFIKGTDCLRRLMEVAPEIPTFIVSKSQDPDDIEAVLKVGAQFFVPKDQALGVVFHYYEYLRSLGELCLFIQQRELRQNLIGNLRYWNFHREHLWRGDKCYHMVGHTYSHMSNVWHILNALLVPLLKSRSGMFGGHGSDERDETLYALAMATWLHDVGHSGNRQYGESHKLRQLHGIISAELLLERPDLFGIHGYVDGRPPPYIGEAFVPPDTVLEIIRRRFALLTALERTRPSAEGEPRDNYPRYRFLVEKIALLCIYHLSGCPVTDDDYQSIRRKGKKMPIGAYEKGDPLGLPITLESVVQLLGADQKKWMLQAIGLLRFADNLDINRNRVGDETEKGHRIALQQRDMEYQFLNLRRTVEDMANQAGLPTNRRQRFMEVFFSQVVCDVRERQGLSAQTRDNQRALLNQIEADVDTHNYDMLVGFIEFIAVQDGHFDLHSAIDNVHVDVVSGMGPKIAYESFLREDELENRTVKVAGQGKEKNLIEHLCGILAKGDGTKAADGYARGEWDSCRKILKELFFDQEPTIILRCRDRNGGGVKNFADAKNPGSN